jgi:uncharacterized cupredoxin-like copper-binding protein
MAHGGAVEAKGVAGVPVYQGSFGRAQAERLGEGEDATLEVRLHRASHYVLWCSLADHREQGMEATLKVRRHKS